MSLATDKPYSAACERNREPILAVLRGIFSGCRQVLEIGSGTGQHAVYFAAAMPQLIWQTSDRAQYLDGIRAWLAEAALPNTPPPLTLDVQAAWPAQIFDRSPHGAFMRFDAMFTANTLHIMSWPEVQLFFAALPQAMSADALLAVYGPFNYGGSFTSESNAAFDADLRQRDSAMGLRDFETVDALAQQAGFDLLQDHPLPANNRLLVWQRRA